MLSLFEVLVCAELFYEHQQSDYNTCQTFSPWTTGQVDGESNRRRDKAKTQSFIS